MRTILLGLLAYFIALASLWAQDRSFGTLPMVRKPMGQQTGAAAPDSAKYQAALRVYNQLVAARGDFRYPVPTFVMRREEYEVAGIDYKQLTITLEEKAFDVCAHFGGNADAAMAFLLGHELAHYYEKHGWRKGFAAEFKDLNIGIQLDTLADDAANETEADYAGGFLAYSAGFGLFDKSADLIQQLYTAYGLPVQVPGYPTLPDRQALSRRTSEKLERLVDVYDMANLLAATGQYSEAYAYYRYILLRYQSREIYNNLGVTAVLDALRYFKAGELKFRYPVELDLESSATKDPGATKNRDKLLRQALFHFDAAISLDPGYAPAYLNKACVYALLGDVKRARFYAAEEAGTAARANHYPKTALDADVLLGILEAREGNAEKARQLFQAAAAGGSSLASLNLRILENKPPEVPPAGLTQLSRVEKIDGQALAAISEDLKFEPQKSVNVSSSLLFHQNSMQGPTSRLFVGQNTATESVILFHLTAPGYTGKTARQIGAGDDRSAVTVAYGECPRSIETPRGQIMVYPNILFILDTNGKVVRWANYSTE